MSVGVRYAHKWIDYAIEAVCNFTPSGEEDCGVNNPGFGSELGTYPLGRSKPAQPTAVRDYDGFEVRLRKRLANRWSVDVSYLLQQAARQLVGHRQLGRSRQQPAAELRPVVQPALLLVRHAGQREQRSARHRSAASVQGAGRPTTCRGARWSASTPSSRAACRARRS